MDSSKNAACRLPDLPKGSDFPAGLRVLVVDDDRTCLAVIGKMLRHCHYDVTTCMSSSEALALLHERKGMFDLVLSDVHMPGMDGFKLLEQIGLGMDLPVIMMSADDNKDVIMRGVSNGACDYLIKPVRMELLKNIWQHVVRKKSKEYRELEISAGNDKQNIASGEGECVSPEKEGEAKIVKRKNEAKGEEGEEVKEAKREAEEREESPQTKKARIVWSVDLHQQFVAAVDQLGVEKAVPKKILELMNHNGLTRENVASHLQKYRLYMKKATESQQHGRRDVPNARDRSFRSSSATLGFDIRALAASSRIPAHPLAAIHPSTRRATSMAPSMPTFDNMNFLNSTAQPASSYKMRSGGFLQPVNNERMNCLYGSSNRMDFRNIGQQNHQMVQPYGMHIPLGQHSSNTLGLPALQYKSSFPGTAFDGQINNSLDMHMTQQGLRNSLFQQQNASMHLPALPLSTGHYANGISSHDIIGQQMPIIDIPNHVSGGIGTNPNTSATNYDSSYDTVPQALDLHDLDVLGNTNFIGLNEPSLECDIISKNSQDQGFDWNLQNFSNYQSGQPIGSPPLTHQDYIADIKDEGQQIGYIADIKDEGQQIGSSLVAHTKDECSKNTCTITKESISESIGQEKPEGEVMLSGSYEDMLINHDAPLDDLLKRQQELFGKMDFDYFSC